MATAGLCGGCVAHLLLGVLYDGGKKDEWQGRMIDLWQWFFLLCFPVGLGMLAYGFWGLFQSPKQHPGEWLPEPSPGPVSPFREKLGEFLEGISGAYMAIGVFLGVAAWVLTFVGCWFYCVAEYGFLLGVGLGWLPALICAYLAFFLTFALWGPALMTGSLWLMAGSF